MNLPTIEPNKHIGILFQPRSGSNVVRPYLSTVTDRKDLSELFNPVGQVAEPGALNYQLLGGGKITRSLKFSDGAPILPEDIIRVALPDAIANLGMLREQTELKNPTVFGIHSHAYLEDVPAFFKLLLEAKNIQYFRLERADVLYSILSLIIARETGHWHNMARPTDNVPVHTFTPVQDLPESFNIPIPELQQRLTRYVTVSREIEEYFGDLPTIYYEQFQFSVANLRNLFNGIPKKIVSIPVTKTGTDYKLIVSNLNEVEDFYEQFVNEHKEYFPQYFGKLPHIQIPACQGRQPRDLSIKIAC